MADAIKNTTFSLQQLKSNLSLSTHSIPLISSYTLWKHKKTFGFLHCVKSVVFGVFLVRIFQHSDWIRRDTEYQCGKIRTGITLNTDTFYTVLMLGWSSNANSSDSFNRDNKKYLLSNIYQKIETQILRSRKQKKILEYFFNISR